MLVFLIFFFLNNDNNIEIKVEQISEQISDIKEHLEKNAIFKTRQINEDSGDIVYTPNPQLDPYASQLYIENKYLNHQNE